MEINNNKVVKMHLVFFVLVLVLGFYAYNRFGVAATVNGKPISRVEYYKSMEKVTGRTLLDRMIDETLIWEEANKKGLKIDQNIIETEIKMIEEKIKSQGITMEEALKSEGMTVDDLKKQISIQKIAEKLASPKTEATQAEIDEYLAKNKNMFAKGTTKEEMQNSARAQILSQAKNEALTTWMDGLRKGAKIIYK